MRLAPRKDHSSSRMLLLAVLLAAGVIAVLWLRRVPTPAPVPLSDVRDGNLVRSNRAAQPPANLSNPPSTPAPEAWREPVTRPGIDASNLYKNAFVHFDRLSEEEKKMLREPREEVAAEKAAALFEKIRAIMDLLREAAKADYCDWGLAPYSFDTSMPHITKGQDLGKLALWAAAFQFPADPAAALTALADRAQLGHHLADTLIGVLVEANFERTAHNLLLQRAGSFDAATAAQALEILRGSKLDGDLSRAFESEMASVGLIGKQLAAANADERAEMLSIMASPADGAAKEAAAKRLGRFLGDPARLAAEVAFIQEYEKAVAAALKLPEAEYQAWRRSMERKLNGGAWRGS